MMPADYESTARALALPVDSPTYHDSPTSPTSTRPLSPTWSRPHSSSFRRTTHGRNNSSSTASFRHRTGAGRLAGKAADYYHSYMATYNKLPLRYQIALSLFGVVMIVLAVLFLVYQGELWAALVPRAEAWRERTGGWLLLWFSIVGVAFPPMIGYGTLVTLGGFIYGIPRGWLIVATANTLGSTLSFLASRHLMSTYVSGLLSSSSHATTFTALSSTLAHDGLSLLIMIRLCPLPYSLSNGAIATLFPSSTVRWPAFMIATAAATPKLIIHVFIGSRIKAIAAGKMDWKDKIVNYGGILLGAAIGVGTSIVIYRRTKRRAAELEAQNKSSGGERQDASSELSGNRRGFMDDPEAQRAVRGDGADDGISLREQSGGLASMEDEEDDEAYRDYESDEGSDVFAEAAEAAGNVGDVEAQSRR